VQSRDERLYQISSIIEGVVACLHGSSVELEPMDFFSEWNWPGDSSSQLTHFERWVASADRAIGPKGLHQFAEHVIGAMIRRTRAREGKKLGAKDVPGVESQRTDWFSNSRAILLMS